MPRGIREIFFSLLETHYQVIQTGLEITMKEEDPKFLTHPPTAPGSSIIGMPTGPVLHCISRNSSSPKRSWLKLKPETSLTYRTRVSFMIQWLEKWFRG